MENNQYPNNNTPMDGASQVPPQDVPQPTYVRAEDAADVTRMAQPVGEPQEGATYVRKEEAVPVETAAPVAPSAPETEMPQAAANEVQVGNDAATSQVSHDEACASDAVASQATAAPQGGASNGASVPPQAPSGKTKRKKHGNFGKFVAVLLIGALIGGAAGGVAGYQMADRNTATPVVTQEALKDAPKDSNGNLSVATIAEHAMPAVVSVYNMANVSQNPFANGMFGGMEEGEQSGDGATAQGYGSGVIISADGLIVTNYHVIEDSDSVVVTTEGDKEYTAEVLGTDASLDLAVLKIDAKDLPYVDIADSDQVKVGDLAVAIGNPLGSEFADTVTDGIISGVDRKISSENGDLGLLQTNASINSGNSGGALLNGQAQLIGINSMKIQSSGMSAVEGMGFAIPSNTVLDFVNSVKDGSHTKNSTKKAWIGLTGYNMNESIARQLDTEQNTGILVAGVTEGSPAAEAGLQQADIIIAADGSAVETFDDLSAILDSKQPGDKVELTVIRQGQTGKVTVTLGTQN